jgi:RNA polymerase sigma-70 factor (ECF subfamily)
MADHSHRPVCLDALRSLNSRREQPVDVHLPDPIVLAPGAHNPEQEALTAESVGFALHVVVDRLAPAERVAFVLHDLFSVPFGDIAVLLGRSVNATKQLASRGAGPDPGGGADAGP